VTLEDQSDLRLDAFSALAASLHNHGDKMLAEYSRSLRDPERRQLFIALVDFQKTVEQELLQLILVFLHPRNIDRIAKRTGTVADSEMESSIGLVMINSRAGFVFAAINCVMLTVEKLRKASDVDISALNANAIWQTFQKKLAETQDNLKATWESRIPINCGTISKIRKMALKALRFFLEFNKKLKPVIASF